MKNFYNINTSTLTADAAYRAAPEYFKSNERTIIVLDVIIFKSSTG